MSKEYNLAVQLIKFRQAWKELTDVSKDIDIDLSEKYPLYLLDFEELTPAVEQWCNLHASRIIQTTPDQIINPTCLRCEFAFKGLSKDGRCVGQNNGIKCGSYPLIPFNKNLVLSALESLNAGNREDLSKLTDDNVLLIYIDTTNMLKRLEI